MIAIQLRTHFDQGKQQHELPEQLRKANHMMSLRPSAWVRFSGRIIRYLIRRIRGDVVSSSTRAYSQEGEDLILQRIFHGATNGFYVDVGAHHPQRFSNTFLFYQKGWCGINIDATPGSMEAFRKARPRDINIEAAIGRKGGESRTLYVFDEPALNSFDESLAHSREGGPEQRVILAKKEVLTEELSEVIERYLPRNRHIDFLSVDVEGLDLEVLQSNAWKVHRPTYVLAECYGVPLSKLSEDPVANYLALQGYEVFAKTLNTVIFRDLSTTPPSP